MRSMILMLACAPLLLACAATQAAAPTQPVAAVTTPIAPQAAPRSPLAIMLGRAGQPNAPDIATVEHSLGAADIRRQDGAGAMMTYRLDTCALLLVFAADAQNTMRLAEAHPGPRQAGQAAPSLDQCATEAGARAHP